MCKLPDITLAWFIVRPAKASTESRDSALDIRHILLSWGAKCGGVLLL